MKEERPCPIEAIAVATLRAGVTYLLVRASLTRLLDKKREIP